MSVAVRGLKTVVAVSVIICATGCASTSTRDVDRTVVPNSLVHVALEDFDIVSFLDVDLHTAVQTREAVESEFSVPTDEPDIRGGSSTRSTSRTSISSSRVSSLPRPDAARATSAQRRLRVKRLGKRNARSASSMWSTNTKSGRAV